MIMPVAGQYGTRIGSWVHRAIGALITLGRSKLIHPLAWHSRYPKRGSVSRGGWVWALPILPSTHFASFFSDVTAFVTGPSMMNPSTSRWIDEPILRPQPIRNQPFPNLPPYVYLSFYQ